MDTIKILGGGISGLTAAINLKKSGFNVEVHEKKSFCGKHSGDFQFLENWTFNKNVIDFLREINIGIDFYFKPIHRFEILSPIHKKYTGKSIKPLMYLVKRSPQNGSIDQSLERQARRSKIKILYNSKLKEKEADIIAIGFKRPKVVVVGVKFKINYSDKIVVLLDNNLSSGFYSYFLVNDNVGEIVCINQFRMKNHKARLDLTVKTFQKILNIKIKNIEDRFACYSDLKFTEKGKFNNQYFIGEAAGFQDHLLGFGMVYAFKSGFYAAKSIVENLDYDKLWRKEFQKQLKTAKNNRDIFERFSNDHFEKIIDILNSKNRAVRSVRGGEDPHDIFHKVYNNSLSRILRF